MYVSAIEDVGVPLNSCVGFIDATIVYITRRKGFALRATFNRYKHRKGIKAQAISTPDGLIFHVYGPE